MRLIQEHGLAQQTTPHLELEPQPFCSRGNQPIDGAILPTLSPHAQEQNSTYSSGNYRALIKDR
jgi:hypothetical protein